MEWAEHRLQEGQRISIPESIYNHGCVKDVDEGLEVNADPWRGGGDPGAGTFS